MSQLIIEALLKEKIGLDAKTIGSSTITRAINQRLSDCGLSDLTTYLKRLQTSPEELEALIEYVVVGETWFFRDHKPFDFLGQYVQSEWLSTNCNETLRILSIPCSTGEEPYSIAIALLEAGLSSNKFCIDGVDISKKALTQAQLGIYSQNSFRGGVSALQNRYFTQIESGYQLCELIRSRVKFNYGNLIDANYFNNKKPYHIIFCRNLLIYLAQNVRQQVIQLLARLLTNNGLLFVGHSETGQALASNFVPVRHPFTFAFRKKTNSKTLVVSRDDNKKSYPPQVIVSPLSLTTSSKHFPNTNPKVTTQTHKITALNSPTILERAKVLADKGQLNESATLCKTHLSQNPMSAEAYVLLGQISQAMGHEAQAEQYFQKAIYLEPQHYEALIHLALLKEYQGDNKSAALLRQRIKRKTL